MALGVYYASKHPDLVTIVRWMNRAKMIVYA